MLGFAATKDTSPDGTVDWSATRRVVPPPIIETPIIEPRIIELAMLASVTRTTVPERFGTEHAAATTLPNIGPCIIQSCHWPNWLPYWDIQATIWLHHDDASSPDAAMTGAVDIHC